ncbi:erythromycin esterase family protein [Rickettsiales endosymbiont of Stachyamoeba lipophora]|uniref:erythromycin esterase family protein n=1 Tax=Rickettsiales endosymbiont of Stachyamoeba lipophora TaxID=2486578 RepID=UPI000F6540A4|nr:erythromycin esterase family protein [Rickettsiales endosymbiont of Stachyamoeba lipophora]AZL16241.1 erythromycin esterase family protein [Rickettsiales endosymbiont of Stachyamoeba lipophora]
MNELQAYCIKFPNHHSDYNALMELVGEAEVVLIGESTHGTEEFYQHRAEMTKRLIIEKSFNTIAIEGDWPDTYAINQYVRGKSNVKSSIAALEGFTRFPTWMWRNSTIIEFIDWLYDYNLSLTESERIGFYGLDLYSLEASIQEIIKFLENVDTEAANRAKERYACFDHFKHDLQSYGYASVFGITKSCEDAVIEQLIDLNTNIYKSLKEKGLKEDELFNAELNARLIKNAEKYYRSMFSNDVTSWNIRDTHMAETLEALSKHLTITRLRPAKIAVWAHNSHIGDARATEMGRKRGELNIGQLARQKYKNKTINIGFLTYSGTVTASSSWDGIAQRKYVRPAIHNSYEAYFHKLNIPRFMLNLKDEKVANLIPNNMLERAIGVIYRPQTERGSHYFYADLANQFDVVIYLDATKAVRPLETTAIWHEGEVFETFPSGI